MSQNGKAHFKNIAAFAARFLKSVSPFGDLCIKGLIRYPWFEIILSDKTMKYSTKGVEQPLNIASCFF